MIFYLFLPFLMSYHQQSNPDFAFSNCEQSLEKYENEKL